ncbi:putative protein kinase-like protein [Trypanosoma grayi]|uniref:putative protein kinase-like protein n=1 Tax=Trypanosoma grayi TaxID=71804 RepID=UPI0004F4ABF4|nr:putative protein kinase-like protein [Trypanosoma grayi]KEG09299.1 putative protein kinase-like protein [Trypanosoma grayi]
MDASVVLSSDTLSPCCASDVSILVGQRSFTENGEGRECSVLIVFDSISCADADLIAEQVECLEQVLPCGITFLGLLVSGESAEKVAACRRSLKDCPRESPLFVATCNGGNVTQCRLVHSGKEVPLTLLSEKPRFVLMACYLRSPLDTLPLVVRTRGGNATNCAVIDLNSAVPLGHSDIWASADGLYAVQLGGTADNSNGGLMCLHITFTPLHSCGRDLYRAICALLPRMKQQPQGVLVRVPSRRNPALAYQWIFTPTEGKSYVPSKAQWGKLRELIEDGTGENVGPLQVVTDGNVEPPQVPAVHGKKGDKSTEKRQAGAKKDTVRNEVQGTSSMAFVPVAMIAFIALAVAFLWPR